MSFCEKQFWFISAQKAAKWELSNEEFSLLPWFNTCCLQQSNKVPTHSSEPLRRRQILPKSLALATTRTKHSIFIRNSVSYFSGYFVQLQIGFINVVVIIVSDWYKHWLKQKVSFVVSFSSIPTYLYYWPRFWYFKTLKV